MTFIFNLLNDYVLSPILRVIMTVCGNNFAIAIFLFTLVINLVLIPLTIKSQKSSVQQARIKPKLDLLKEECGDDKQKYSLKMQELYQKENVSMAGGCLPMILRLVILMSIYYLVLSPISYLTPVEETQITAATDAIVSEEESKASRGKELAFISEVTKADFKSDNADVLAVKEEVDKIDFHFLGIDLTETPKFTFNLANANINWIIPFLSFAAAMLSSLISMALQKSVNPDAPSMKGMMLTMPLISLFIAFSAPCGLGYYWACSSLISGGLQAGVQYFYGPNRMLAKSRAKSIVKAYELEKKTINAPRANVEE